MENGEEQDDILECEKDETYWQRAKDEIINVKVKGIVEISNLL